METRRAFRNATAMSFLLAGLALVAFAAGGIVQFTRSVPRDPTAVADVSVWSAPAIGLVVAALYLAAGSALIRFRPRLPTDPPPPETPAPFLGRDPLVALRRAAVIVSLIVALLGILLLAGTGPYPREAALAAVVILAGAFGLVASLVARRPDPNVRATGAVLALLAGALLLYAQLHLPYVRASPGGFGAWENTNLVIPEVFGPVALMILGLGGLAQAYAPPARRAGGARLGFVGAGLVYGLGAVATNFAAFLDTPWSRFAGSPAADAFLLLALTAGTLLLAAAGVAILVTAVLGFGEAGRGWTTGPPQKREASTGGPA